MEIRHLQEKDFKQSLELEAFAFQGEMVNNKLDKEQGKLKWASAIGVYDGETLAAMLSILPLATYINGKRHLMGGISSVATWPEYRRQGMVKKLMKTALLEMWENGQNVSFLHPFSYSFYRKFGWELAFNEKVYTIPVKYFRQKWGGKGYVRSYQGDVDVLHTIYTTYAHMFNGMLTREEFVWENWVMKGKQQIIIAYRDDGEPEGYIIYMVKKDVLDVKEFAYTSINGRKVIMAFIANHDSMAKEVKMPVPENDQLALLLNEPQMTQTTDSYMMARIVNVHAFLREYTFHTGKEHTVSLHVTDAFLPENTGTYFIQSFENKTNVTMVKDTGKPKAGIQCGIEELTMLLMGYARVHTLVEMERIFGPAKEVEKLAALIPDMQPFLVDFF